MDCQEKWEEKKEDEEADPHINSAHVHHEKFPDLLSEINVIIMKSSHTLQGILQTEQGTEVRICAFTPAAPGRSCVMVLG